MQPPGGGGTFDGMETRVAKLEAHVERVQKDVAELLSDSKNMRETLAVIKTKLDSLPSKAELATATGEIRTLGAKLDDKVSTRAAYTISIVMAGLIVTATLGGVTRIAGLLGLGSAQSPPSSNTTRS